MGDVWLLEYDNAQKLLNQVATDVKNYEVQMRSNPSMATKNNATGIRRGLVNVTTELSRLMDTLTYGNLRINERELIRRRQLVESLVTAKNNLSAAFERAVNNTSAKDELFGGDSGRRQWGKPKETEVTKEWNNQQVFDRNNHIMKEQDESLDVLSQSIMRQKVMAEHMNAEVTLHNELLDDVEIGVERVHGRLVNTNDKMEHLTKNAGSTCLIVIIVVLILFIVALLATDSGCKIYNDPNHCP
ncbi:putative syntaxin 8 [Cavenderia fasciculata]|uniref:Syntaxin 8 n=1 Tax=Cavenderia fasciculata TaxID=261658 RepID=F4PTN5_CACFS|nr:putative syntaxin 8 [Cavenderia fasciculata]EGG21705.1 putative syntaxin 8 [Cavenderia fasciculata]|eukprot:XP_004359555.1 putative syntaxin 8 [Cavenderia fasciculata]